MRRLSMDTTQLRTPNENVIELLDRIQERVMRAIPDMSSTTIFDRLMQEAQARGLTPLECLDYIEEHRRMLTAAASSSR